MSTISQCLGSPAAAKLCFIPQSRSPHISFKSSRVWAVVQLPFVLQILKTIQQLEPLPDIFNPTVNHIDPPFTADRWMVLLNKSPFKLSCFIYLKEGNNIS